MTALLALLLVVSVVLLLPATLLVFTVREGRGRGLSPTTAVVAAVATGLSGLGVAAALGASPARATVVALVLGVSPLVWVPVARPWDVRGLLAWALTVDTGLAYLAYVLAWTFGAGLGIAGTLASLALWLLEVFVFVIGIGYMWELVDVLARRSWPARLDPATLPDSMTSARPFVSLHVPTHNEPPDMVIATLEQLLLLDYDAYEILLVDNNTTDPALWRPVEEFCARQDRITFLHLEDWPGFKSGALNHALTVTDPRAEVIGIVDADYHVLPEFLAECAPLFGDAGVSFVQTPQDYRDWRVAPYFRRLYYSYGYFFDVSQRSRNERNGAIFGGTMGLIRRSELAAAGGWDEWCITEDAELSLRLLRAGGRGVHIDRSYGYGVMPLTFEALKRQRFRWCFGGIQILRMHWRSLLPGRRTEDNRLGPAQRWAYLVGGLQWYGDLASLLFTAFLLAGAVDAAFGDGLVIRRLSGLILLSVVTLVVLGAVRSLALVRRTSGARWGEALGAFGLWLGLGLTVARASTQGLLAREGVFLRTPKVRGEPRPRDAVRGNRWEAALALLCTAVAVAALVHGSTGSLAVGGLLLLQAAGFAAAPLNSLAAIRSDLPEELRRRRRQGGLSWERLARPARRGATVALVAAVLVVGFVALAAPLGSPDLRDVPDRATRRTPQEVAPTPTPGRRTPSRAGSTGPAATPPSVAPASTATPTAGPTRPTQAASPTRPTQAASPTHPTQAATPTQASQPGQPTQAATSLTQATQPSPTRPTQASSPTHPAQASSTARPTHPAPTHSTGRP
ncbi:MAG: glycosyltransferase family 2 protein [Nocardioides sp.]